MPPREARPQETLFSRPAPLLLALLALLLAAATLRMAIGDPFGWPQGSLAQSAGQLFIGKPWFAEASIGVMDIRLLRVVDACLVGAALAAAGVALQALLRNPLAEPFILGLSSGAGVGVMTQMFLAYHLHRTFGANHIGALLGTAATMLIVYGASRRRGTLDPLGLLLVGVVISTINGAIIMLLNYLPGPAGLRDDVARWMVGYLNEGVGAPMVRITFVGAAAGITLLAWAGRSMDVATFSDTEAMSLGVNLSRLRILLFAVASVLAAGAVVLAGPIAFVGLICPHLARLMLGPRHRTLVLGSALLGAILILLADTVSVAIDLWRGIGLLPIGIFTAMIGGPVFLWMLRPQLGRGTE